MAKLMKGNYQLPKGKTKSRAKKKTKNLTTKFEETALAKLGGSLCFVMKGDTFVWKGDDGEGTSE
jgi:hypothetical protein